MQLTTIMYKLLGWFKKLYFNRLYNTDCLMKVRCACCISLIVLKGVIPSTDQESMLCFNIHICGFRIFSTENSGMTTRVQQLLIDICFDK